MKLASWNINGLRAVMRKGELVKFLSEQQPDILCLQEVKIKPDQIDFQIPDYQLVLNSAERSGYAGTGVLISNRIADQVDIAGARYNLPVDLANRYGMTSDQFGDPNTEGRVLVVELPDYYVATVYTPNAKADLSRLPLRFDEWDPAFTGYMQELCQTKPVIFCGDLNVAHRPIDLANPKQNEGKHGFTKEERAGFDGMLAAGFVDSFRAIHGDMPEQYTWWSHWAHARERNVGWRIDYFMVDQRLRSRIAGAEIYRDQLGSDHCPIGLVID